MFEILYDPSFPLAHALTPDVRAFLDETVITEEVAGVPGYETSLVVKTNLPMFLSNLGLEGMDPSSVLLYTLTQNSKFDEQWSIISDPRYDTGLDDLLFRNKKYISSARAEVILAEPDEDTKYEDEAPYQLTGEEAHLS